jgi:hypothetical protein
MKDEVPLGPFNVTSIDVSALGIKLLGGLPPKTLILVDERSAAAGRAPNGSFRDIAKGRGCEGAVIGMEPVFTAGNDAVVAVEANDGNGSSGGDRNWPDCDGVIAWLV